MRSHSPGLRGRAFKVALALAVGTPLVVLGVGAARSQTTAVEARRQRLYPAGDDPRDHGLARDAVGAERSGTPSPIDVTEKGTIEKKPQNDEEWATLRGTAVALAEATNLLVVPGRHAAPAGDQVGESGLRADAGEDRRAAREPASRVDRTRARAARGRDGGRARDRRQEHRRHLGRRRHDRRRVRGLPLAVLVPEPAAAASRRRAADAPARAPAGARRRGSPRRARLLGLRASLRRAHATVNTHAVSASDKAATTAFSILAAISFCHLLNDMMQSLLPAIYPILKENYGLDFGQIGIITFTFQLTASLLQPVIGYYTDHRPKPYSLSVGMGFSLLGLLLLSRAGELPDAAALGRARRQRLRRATSGSVARRADGGRAATGARTVAVSARRQHRLVDRAAARGGHCAAERPVQHRVVRRSPRSSGCCCSRASGIGTSITASLGSSRKPRGAAAGAALSRSRVTVSVAVLVLLMFSKFFYTASMSSYFTFYLIDRFDVSVRSAQIHLFVFLASVAFGTVAGGVARRPLRPEVRDLGVDSRRSAVHARAAVRESLLDRRAHSADRDRFSRRHSRRSSCTGRSSCRSRSVRWRACSSA